MRITLVVILIILFNGLYAWLNNQAQYVGADVAKGKLASLSYAPFRVGQSPLKEVFPSTEEIDQDLRLMAKTTHAIRTYASDGRMGPIVQLAGKYGLKVTQGAWLGYNASDNRKEITALINAANSYPDVIKRVIVGNEVLLRGEMKPETLIEYIRAVRKAVKQPVSYADVWSMYTKYPELIEEVDFITIHILPYWEDEPIAVDAAARHIERAYRAVKKEAESIVHGKPVFIGESGWPSRGRQRGDALPSVVNAARFIRALIHTSNENGFDYNIVEAFNQQWKSELEGVVGANWGLFSAKRKQIIPLTGPVYEHPDWFVRWLLATLLFVALALAYKRRFAQLTVSQSVILLGFMQILLVLLVAAVAELWSTSYSVAQHMYTVFIVMVNILTGSLIIERAWRMLRAPSDGNGSGTQLYILYLLIAAFAVYKTYGFSVWGRYLSFPSAQIYIPIAGLIGLVLIHWITAKRLSRHTFNLHRLIGNTVTYYALDKIAGFTLLSMGLAMIYGETRAFMLGRDMIQAYPDFYERLQLSLILTMSNGQLLLWLVSLLVLALPFLFAGRMQHIQQRAV